MSSNIQIISKSELDYHVIENSNTDLVYPVANLQIKQVSRKWRTDIAEGIQDPEQLICDLTEFYTMSGWSLNGHNLSYASKIRLTLYTYTAPMATMTNAVDVGGTHVDITYAGGHGATEGSSLLGVHCINVVGMTDLNDKVFDGVYISPTVMRIELATVQSYTSGGTSRVMVQVFDTTKPGVPVQYGWGIQPWGLGGWYGYDTSVERRDFTHIWFPDVTASFMRVIIEDASNTDGYIEAGRMFLGNSIKPKYNMLFGATIDYQTQTRLQRTRSGSLLSDNRPTYKVASFILDYLSENEAMELLSIMDDPSIAGDALISMYPDHTGLLGQQTTLLGRFTSHSPLARSEYGYSFQVEFEEGK